MNYPSVSNSGYTIFSKSNCSYCVKAKNLLADFDLTIYNCDEFLEKDKEDFLNYIKKICGKQHNSFPIIFKDSNYVGGYSELLVLLKDIFSNED